MGRQAIEEEKMKMDDWTKAEDPEIEQAKTEYEQAQAAEKLRAQLTKHVAGFVNHGASRDWANAQLARLGATQITGVAEYRMNIPVTGAYGWRTKANSRAEALAKFQEQVNRVAEAGKITADGSHDNVYELKIVGDPIVYSGPEDPSIDGAEDLDLDGLKAAIRDMFKQGVTEHDWNLGYASRALASMGLEPLPKATTKTVKVPVSGFAEVSVMVFEGDEQPEVQRAAAGFMARTGSVYIKPEEIGAVTVTEESADDEDEDDDGPF